MDCNSGQFPPPVPVVPRTHNKDAKLSQGEMPIVEKVAWAKGKGKAFKSFFTHKSHESTNARTIVLHQFPHSFFQPPGQHGPSLLGPGALKNAKCLSNST